MEQNSHLPLVSFLNQKVFVCNQNLNCLYAFHSYVTRTFVPSRTIPEFKKNLPSYSLAITNQLLNSMLSWPYPSHLVGDEPEKEVTLQQTNLIFYLKPISGLLDKESHRNGLSLNFSQHVYHNDFK